MRLEPGGRLDRYQLLTPFAKGGMAEIWLGRIAGPHGFERLVALKTMLAEHVSEPEFRKMLVDEARLASAIRHTNVVEILDFGDHDGVLYIVMEWVDGDSLSTLRRELEARDEQLPMGIALRVCADACHGLHAAHELADGNGELLGVVHRDVSPQNVLVKADGVVKLIDFGVAKARERLADRTSTGVIKGKMRYMSPEQALGQEIDRRSDIWSMGALLQFLLTGRTPYAGSSDLATLHKIVSREPPAPLPDEVPKPVAKVIQRALEPRPEARFETADELALALEAAMRELDLSTSVSDVARYLRENFADAAEQRKRFVENALREGATPPSARVALPSARPRRRVWPAVALVLAAVSASVVVTLASRPKAEPEPTLGTSSVQAAAQPTPATERSAEPPSSSEPTTSPASTTAKRFVARKKDKPPAAVAPQSSKGRLIGF